MLIKLSQQETKDLFDVLYHQLDDPDHLKIRPTYLKLKKAIYTNEYIFNITDEDIAIIIYCLEDSAVLGAELYPAFITLSNRYVTLSYAGLNEFVDNIMWSKIHLSDNFKECIDNLNLSEVYIVDTISWEVKEHSEKKETTTTA